MALFPPFSYYEKSLNIKEIRRRLVIFLNTNVCCLVRKTEVLEKIKIANVDNNFPFFFGVKSCGWEEGSYSWNRDIPHCGLKHPLC